MVPFIAKNFLTREQNRNWLRARSVSEGIKSEVFTFRAGAAPYDGADRETLLNGKVREIRDWGKDLIAIRARAVPPNRPAPGPLDAEAYLRDRVSGQIEKYYEPKAKTNADLSERFRLIAVALAGLAALLSGVATFLVTSSGAELAGKLPPLAPWVAVLTTIGGSIAAYAAASRYDFQSTAYYATAARLRDLLRDWKASGKGAPSPEWSELVRQCEEAISVENRGWMAKFDVVI
jgi:hypothetical protein